MYRLSSLAGASLGVGRKQRVRLLRIYLIATTFLYAYGVVFTLFPLRNDISYGNPIGGIIAIILGVAALIQLAVQPDRHIFATVASMAATPVVMAFHVSMTAEYVCLIAPMFLAMYLRAFHPPYRAWMLISALTAGCMAAIAVAPARHVGVITFLIVVVAIAAAAESFGLLMRAMFTAACTDPMTGLLNRAGWEIGTADLLRSCRSSASVVVVALDIDGLKKLNDTQGHEAGDRRIIDYARQWKQLVPRRAVLARLGGDEFAVCIVNETSGVVEELLDCIRMKTPAVSLGTAKDDGADANIAALYAQADAGLYRSRGRRLQGPDTIANL